MIEQKFLKPVPSMNIAEEIVTRTVRKDNTVLYRGNRYSVPYGTYHPGCQIKLEEDGNKIKLIDQDSGSLVAEHRVTLETGKLIQNNNHLRDNSTKIEELFEKTLESLGGSLEAKTMLEEIRREKPRYSEDLVKVKTLWDQRIEKNQDAV